VDPTRHHVCLGVEDLDAAVAVLEAAGIAVVRTAQHTPSGPVEQVFCTDPCGNTIELQRDAT
jgi:predicted enzyme related to lactoylglutathione lyase